MTTPPPTTADLLAQLAATREADQTKRLEVALRDWGKS